MFLATLALFAVIFYMNYSIFNYFSVFHSNVNNIVFSFASLFLAHFLRKRYFHGRKIDPTDKAVFITGCDSGFGHNLAKRLQSRGFLVFAGCLFPEGSGAKELQESCTSRLRVVPLDVRSDESVANALKFVKENIGSNVLWAVVNNAGILKGSSFDFSTIQHFKDVLDVNTLGPIRVCKAFLPMLKMCKGRIVNVASVAGRISMIDVCPYTVSKHAVVALTECLNLEMAVWGVRVISIEPEGFKTPLSDIPTQISRMRTELTEVDQSVVSSYGEEYINSREKMFTRMGDLTVCSDISIVVNMMESAVIEKDPDSVYKPRRNWLSKSFLSLYEIAPFSLQRKIVPFIMPSSIPKDAKI